MCLHDENDLHGDTDDTSQNFVQHAHRSGHPKSQFNILDRLKDLKE